MLQACLATLRLLHLVEGLGAADGLGLFLVQHAQGGGRLASQHLAQIERKIDDLRDMRDTLKDLVRACAGDDRPDCPILKSLAAPDQ